MSSLSPAAAVAASHYAYVVLDDFSSAYLNSSHQGDLYSEIKIFIVPQLQHHKHAKLIYVPCVSCTFRDVLECSIHLRKKASKCPPLSLRTWKETDGGQYSLVLLVLQSDTRFQLWNRRSRRCFIVRNKIPFLWLELKS